MHFLYDKDSPQVHLLRKMELMLLLLPLLYNHKRLYIKLPDFCDFIQMLKWMKKIYKATKFTTSFPYILICNQVSIPIYYECEEVICHHYST